jgi:hypothetical protein
MAALATDDRVNFRGQRVAYRCEERSRCTHPLRFAGPDPPEVEEAVMQVLNRLVGVLLGILGAVVGVLLGIVAGLVWLVGAVLCVTVILIPLGIPVMKLGSRLLSLAGDLMHIGG